MASCKMETGHAVYLRVVRNAEGHLEYQLFNSNYKKRFFRSFTSCAELADVLKYDLFFNKKTNSYLPIYFNIYETEHHVDRPIVKTVLDNIFRKRKNHPKINQKSKDGATALYVAARAGSAEVVNYLVAKGAKIAAPSLENAKDVYIHRMLTRQQSFFKRNWRYIACLAIVGALCVPGIGTLILAGVSVAAMIAWTITGFICGTFLGFSIAVKREHNSKISNQSAIITKKPASTIRTSILCPQTQFVEKTETKLNVERKSIEKKSDNKIFEGINITSIANVQDAIKASQKIGYAMLLKAKEIDGYTKTAIGSLYTFLYYFKLSLKGHSKQISERTNLIKFILQRAVAAYQNILTASSDDEANNIINDFRDDLSNVAIDVRHTSRRFFSDSTLLIGCITTALSKIASVTCISPLKESQLDLKV